MFTYFIVIANIYFFQIDRLEPSFTDSVFRFRFRFRDSVSGFRLLVLPSLARTQEESGVKYFPINQFIKGSTSVLVMNSYLNDNLEDKQCYFSLGSFSTKQLTESCVLYFRHVLHLGFT